MNTAVIEQEKDLCRCLMSIIKAHPFCKKNTDKDYNEAIHLSPQFQVLAVVESLQKHGIECEIEHKMIVIPDEGGVIVPALSLKGWTLGIDLEETWEGIAQQTLKQSHPDVSVKSGIWTMTHDLTKEERALAMQENEGRLWIMNAKVSSSDDPPRQFKKVVSALMPIVDSFFNSKTLEQDTQQVKSKTATRRTI